MSSFKIINPYTLEWFDTIPYESNKTYLKKLNSLNKNFYTWKQCSINERKDIIIQLSRFLTTHKNTLATLISTDMGKPIRESISEIEKSIACCDYYIDSIPSIEQHLIKKNAMKEPLGTILAIMPWNFPVWQTIRFLVPTLIAGNTCLIKPAPTTYRVTQKLMDFFYNTSSIVVDQCIPTNSNCEELIKHPHIAGVSLTGSVNAGKIVGSIATAHLKPCVLELGGSDPYIIFNDANIEKAIETAIKARFLNNGQTCISAKRFLFQDTLFEKALTLFVKKTSQFITYNNPLNNDTTVGPLANKNGHTNLISQLKRANISPKNIAYQHHQPNPQGFYFPATIIDATTLSNDNVLLNEEIFGPIAVCQSFTDTRDAITKANSTQFGLGASIWTTSQTIKDECIKNIECGTIAINSMVTSKPNIPFGGRKNSGLGIELGIDAVFSFTGEKHIHN